MRMPSLLLDRVPFPSLPVYLSVSVAGFSASLYYALAKSPVPPDEGYALHRMMDDPVCVWMMINMSYCCLILVGKLIQRLVFGDLRVSEQQHLKDKFWNFIFYKFIFIVGVMNVQYMGEVVLWCSWFSILGFLHLLTQLSKDRFEYLSFSPTTPRWTHVRIVSLLSGILGSALVLFGVCIIVGLQTSINTFAFMAAECVILNLQTLYVIVRYGIHMYDIMSPNIWENRATYVYYTELWFELITLTIDFGHHLHMLLWGNIFLSMASLVICMQLRYLFYEIQRRFKRHKNFLCVVRHVEQHYRMATPEEVSNITEHCAICWDKMESARRLPCGHFFHNSCLRSWLEQDTSCPTCRKSLSVPALSPERRVGGVGRADDHLDDLADQRDEDPLLVDIRHRRRHIRHRGTAAAATTNHFFHFDGSRYVSWLPSFSVEVTHTQLLRGRQPVASTSQLDNMARQVQQMFPHIPLEAILDDLRVTHSVEVTIDNILDERLVVYHPDTYTSEATNEPEASSVPETAPVNEVPEPVDNTPSPVAPVEETEKMEDSSSSLYESHQLLSIGGRFSKSSQEREKMLAERKKELLNIAKRRYLARQTQHNIEQPSAPETRRLLSSEPSDA